MWFVAALLTFSLVYAALRAVRPGRPAPGPPFSAGVIVVAASAITAICFLVWLAWRLDAGDTFLNLRWGMWPQGAVLFALGVHAREVAGVCAFTPTLVRRLGWSALVGFVLLVTLAAVALARGTFETAPKGIGWWTLALALLYGAISVTSTLWLVAWSQRSLTSPRRTLQRAGRASYAAYFLHPWCLPRLWRLSHRWR